MLAANSAEGGGRYRCCIGDDDNAADRVLGVAQQSVDLSDTA